jgi:hypothetical protein
LDSFEANGILEEFDTKTFEDAYPSFPNDPFAKAYLNEVDDVINPDDCTIDIVMIYS